MKYILIFLLIPTFGVLYANDGAFYMNGNQLIPVNETQVELRKEILTIKREGRNILIDVDYTFYNPGKAKKVLMGFEAPMPRGAADFIYDRWIMTRNHPYLKGFIVEINGERIPYKADIVNKQAFNSIGSLAGFPQAEIDLLNARYKDSNRVMNGYRNTVLKQDKSLPYREFAYTYVYVNYFDAEFQTGINKVHHTYSFPVSGTNDMPLNFEYILTAANRWANNQIDDFTLVIDMDGFSEFYMPQSFFKGTDLWNDVATMKVVDSTKATEWWEEYMNGYMLVRGDGSKKPLVYKQMNFKPKGELRMSNYIDINQAMYWYDYYSEFLSDTAVFDVAVHEIAYSFYAHNQDLRYAKDEFTLQVLRNYPFAIRGYPFKNRKLRKYYESLDWYEAKEKCTFTTEDLTIEELKWIQRLSVFQNKEN